MTKIMHENFKSQICWKDTTDSHCTCPKCFGCRRKKKHSMAEAQAEAHRLNSGRSGKTRGSRIKPYNCPWCEYWHVGHDNKYRRNMNRYISYMERRKVG